ncbi:putative pentatricopeptide repeat-containing protein [Platanthera zijinensis]|uniref:Pentatricopeptide repeat-containing protein n=1 Tax=Platanthera zijinensis TaxID=2320716 RepID=A0AAP0B7Y7_9ASPA
MVVRLLTQDAFRWNAVLGGLLTANCPQKAFFGFLYMRGRRVRVDGYTILLLLKAFTLLPAFIFPSERLHSYVFKLGFESNIIVQTSLLKTYGLFGNLQSAFKVFDETPQKDIVLWNALIAAYEQSGHPSIAAECLRSMFNGNVRPNEVTLVSIISSFSQLAALAHGRVAHGYAIKNLIRFDSFVQNTLIRLYCRCGRMRAARRIFEKMRGRNEVSWSTMINGYTDTGRLTLALDLFKNMVAADVIPDEVTVLSVVTMCMNLGSFELGKWIDDYVTRSRYRGIIRLENALIGMHSKCGDIRRSCEIFNLMKVRNVVSWTSMIQGLALHGHGMDALTRFAQMQREGFWPDEILFLAILSACNYANLVAEGRKCFKSMVLEYELMPWMEHYGVMVDMLCRGGLLNEAFEIISGMHIKPDGVIWRTLIRASQEEGQVGIVGQFIDLLIKIEPENSENYIMKSSLHGINGEWNNVEDVRHEMGTSGVSKKSPGCSWIEAKHLA